MAYVGSVGEQDISAKVWCYRHSVQGVSGEGLIHWRGIEIEYREFLWGLVGEKEICEKVGLEPESTA